MRLQKEEAEETPGLEDGAAKHGASYDAVVAQLRVLKERMQRLLEDAGISCDVVKCDPASHPLDRLQRGCITPFSSRVRSQVGCND